MPLKQLYIAFLLMLNTGVVLAQQVDGEVATSSKPEPIYSNDSTGYTVKTKDTTYHVAPFVTNKQYPYGYRDSWANAPEPIWPDSVWYLDVTADSLKNERDTIIHTWDNGLPKYWCITFRGCKIGTEKAWSHKGVLLEEINYSTNVLVRTDTIPVSYINHQQKKPIDYSTFYTQKQVYHSYIEEVFGPYKRYFDNGELQISGFAGNDGKTHVFKEGNRDGSRLKYFKRDGIHVRKEEAWYQFGGKKHILRYTKKPVKGATTGTLHGTSKEWDTKGTLIKKSIYKKGKPKYKFSISQHYPFHKSRTKYPNLNKEYFTEEQYSTKTNEKGVLVFKGIYKPEMDIQCSYAENGNPTKVDTCYYTPTKNGEDIIEHCTFYQSGQKTQELIRTRYGFESSLIRVWDKDNGQLLKECLYQNDSLTYYTTMNDYRFGHDGREVTGTCYLLGNDWLCIEPLNADTDLLFISKPDRRNLLPRPVGDKIKTTKGIPHSIIATGTGTITGSNNEGIVKLEYKDHTRHGSWIKSDGEKIIYDTYDDGELVVTRIHTTIGDFPEKVITYTDSTRWFTTYYQGGKIKSKYKKTLHDDETYKKHTSIWLYEDTVLFWHPNDKLAEQAIYKKQPDSVKGYRTIQYDKEYQPFLLTHGSRQSWLEGEYKQYHPNGVLKFFASYKDGKRIGHTYMQDSTGIKITFQFESSYLYPEKVIRKLWSIYTNEQELVVKGHDKEGRRHGRWVVKDKAYSHAGKEENYTYTRNYKHGYLHGQQSYYMPATKWRKQAVFKNGFIQSYKNTLNDTLIESYMCWIDHEGFPIKEQFTKAIGDYVFSFTENHEADIFDDKGEPITLMVMTRENGQLTDASFYYQNGRLAAKDTISDSTGLRLYIVYREDGSLLYKLFERVDTIKYYLPYVDRSDMDKPQWAYQVKERVNRGSYGIVYATDGSIIRTEEISYEYQPFAEYYYNLMP